MWSTRASVLTVEDDPITRADLRVTLELAGFSVCADARDGEEAVELARLHEPDAIVLDLGLPRVDGIEATRRILAERRVPIVALTGRSRELAEQAVEAGAVSYVRKPFAESTIVGALDVALAGHRRAIAEARSESRRTIACILDALGYPDEWADVLERQAYARGQVWRERPRR